MTKQDEENFRRETERAQKERPVRRNCHDCGAKPGEMHKPNCDSPRCNICGQQLMCCGHKAGNSVHTGIEAQELKIICDAHNLFCKWVVDGKWPGSDLDRGHWQKCARDDPDASYDLNRGLEIWLNSLNAVRGRAKSHKD